jgi:transketolase
MYEHDPDDPLVGLGAKLSAPFTLPLVAVTVASQIGDADTLVTVTTIVGAGSALQSDPPPMHPGSAPQNSEARQRINRLGGTISRSYIPLGGVARRTVARP